MNELLNTSNNQHAHDFVGIKCSGNDTTVFFPIGFHGYNGPVHISEYTQKSSSEFKQFRHDAKLLTDVLFTIGANQDNDEFGLEIIFGNLNENNSSSDIAPSQAWYFLIQDFLSNGYWSETKQIFQEQKTGKINWKQTIKRQTPYIQNNNAIYLNFIVQKTLQNEDTLISLIHKWCVYESFYRLGWLFTDYMPEQPNIHFQHDLFLSVINNKINSTFNNDKRIRLLCMRAVIINTYEKNSNYDYQIGTTKFEIFWENMIDYMLGTEFGENKEKYYPHPSWKINGINNEQEANSKKDADHRLRPDTIMIVDDNIFVLDAKYRNYCQNKEIQNLPWATEINKQITYGEYAKKISDDKTVYNAFILPFDAKNFNQKHYSNYCQIGCAYGDWKDIDERYSIIQGILMDTKYVMTEYAKTNNEFQKNIADLIKNKTENYIKDQNDNKTQT